MGYEVTRFTHTIDEEFHCSICAMILKEPTQSPCEHLFCNECIQEWLTVDQSCPVERRPLTLEDLKPVVRAFRNVVNKFEIKCDFESKGCAAIVKLENLQGHVGRCDYNPNAPNEMRHQEKISKLNDQVSLQNEKINKLNDAVNSLCVQQQDHVNKIIRQNDKIAMLNNEVKSQSKEIQRVNDQLHLQRNKVTKLYDDLNQLCQNEIITKAEDVSQLSTEINHLVNQPAEFQVWRRMEISMAQPNVIKVDNGFLYVQSAKSSFKIEILRSGNFVTIIGLARRFTSDWSPLFGNKDSFYQSGGRLCLGGKFKKIAPEWQIGDTIECGIKFTNEVVNNGRRVYVYFNKNGEFIGEKLVTMPVDGLFPTVYMLTGSKIIFRE